MLWPSGVPDWVSIDLDRVMQYLFLPMQRKLTRCCVDWRLQLWCADVTLNSTRELLTLLKRAWGSQMQWLMLQVIRS